MSVSFSRATSLVILAGGASRRMGVPHKAFLRVGGREVLDRLLRGPGAGFRDIVVGAPASAELADALARYGWSGGPERFRREVDGAGLRIVPDRRPGSGPLAGLETALAAARGERAWVLACDLPFMVPEVGRILLSALASGRGGATAAVPVVDGRAQPLCAAYERGAARLAGALLDAGRRRTTDWLEELDAVRLPAARFREAGDPKRLFLNLNEPADLARAERLAREAAVDG